MWIGGGGGGAPNQFTDSQGVSDQLSIALGEKKRVLIRRCEFLSVRVCVWTCEVKCVSAFL